MKKVLIVMALAIVASSCMKQKDLDSDLGTPIESIEVQKAVAKAWGGADPAVVIKKDDFVYIENYQRVQGGAPFSFLDEATKVDTKSVSQDGKYVLHNLIRQYRENYADAPSKLSSVTQPFDVPNTSLDLQQQSLASQKKLTLMTDLMQKESAESGGEVKQRQLSLQIVAMLFYACASEPEDGVTFQCYNLQTSTEERPAPDLVREQPNCGGLPNCKMKVSNVSFDLVMSKEQDGAKTSEKIKFQMAITQDAPYFARVLDYCQTGLVYVPKAGQKVLVNVCSYVKNFQFGH